MLYFILGCVVLWAILAAKEALTEAAEDTKRKMRKAILVFLGVIIALLLLRFGQFLPAIIMGVFTVLLPWLQRIMQLMGIYRFFKSFQRQKSQPHSKQDQPRPGNMSLDQAREILEVRPGATKKEIKDAYQKLMKKNHPDTGGSTFLASQINMAKEILLADLKDNDSA